MPHNNFTDQLAKVTEFFKPENLAKQNIKYEGEIGLLVIDVQKEYCDPKTRGNSKTDKVAERIQSLVPEFRKTGVPVYAVYFNDGKPNYPSGYDFYKFQPEIEDTLVGKTEDSAFDGSGIESILRKDQKNLLLACGFNASACVRSTLLDAIDHGFNVCVLKDLIENDNENTFSVDWALNAMQEHGIAVEDSKTVLKTINARKKAAGIKLA